MTNEVQKHPKAEADTKSAHYTTIYFTLEIFFKIIAGLAYEWYILLPTTFQKVEKECKSKRMIYCSIIDIQ